MVTISLGLSVVLCMSSGTRIHVLGKVETRLDEELWTHTHYWPSCSHAPILQPYQAGSLPQQCMTEGNLRQLKIWTRC